MTEAQAVAFVKQAVRAAGSLRKCAVELGVSPAFLCEVCNGKTPPSAAVLTPLGLERVTTYRRIK